MKEWFTNLQPREQLILGAGGAAACIIVLWGLIWSPLRNGVVDLQESVADKRDLLVDVARAEQLQGNAAPAAVRNDSQSLFVLIDSTAQAAGLVEYFTARRPDGPNAISVSFRNAPFDGLLSWLIGLERSQGIAVETASFTSTGEPGLVSGQLFLRRI
jgi:type II secretory pathway component PulM